MKAYWKLPKFEVDEALVSRHTLDTSPGTEVSTDQEEQLGAWPSIGNLGSTRVPEKAGFRAHGKPILDDEPAGQGQGSAGLRQYVRQKGSEVDVSSEN